MDVGRIIESGPGGWINLIRITWRCSETVVHKGSIKNYSEKFHKLQKKLSLSELFFVKLLAYGLEAFWEIDILEIENSS